MKKRNADYFLFSLLSMLINRFGIVGMHSECVGADKEDYAEG